MKYLNQVRKGLKKLINESPEQLTFYKKPLVDDGNGNLVEDPYGTPIPIIIKCRISHERRVVEKNDEGPAGLSTNLSRFIMVDYKTTINENETFSWNNKSWRIGAVDPLKKFGGVYGYQAPLEESS